MTNNIKKVRLGKDPNFINKHMGMNIYLVDKYNCFVFDLNKMKNHLKIFENVKYNQ